MAYVSVGQVENLEEAISGLQSAYDSMESACQAQIAAAEVKLAEAQQEADHSAQLFESALAAEMKAGQQLEQARALLYSSRVQLGLAVAALGGCIAVSPINGSDCSAQEAEVAADQSAVAEAESAVSVAEEVLEMAKDHRMQMEQRNEMARQCLDMATQLAETVQNECATRLANAAAHLETGKARLESAKAALNGYLEAKSSSSAENTISKSQTKNLPSNGPEDQAFDKQVQKRPEECGEKYYKETSFEKVGDDKRKSTSRPDGLSVNDTIKTYEEDKRPSEYSNDVMTTTYANDPIADQRIKAREEMKQGEISKDEAESKIYIAEHDDHYEKKGVVWDDPKEIKQNGQTEKLAFNVPEGIRPERTEAIIKQLEDDERNPVVTRKDGVVRISYDPKRIDAFIDATYPPKKEK